MDSETLMQRKVFRLNHGVAPEDETVEQAQNTGRLRNDPNYVVQWSEVDDLWFTAHPE